MTGYHFTATCFDCEGLLHPVTHGRPLGTESRAIARCTECGCEWLIACYLRRVSESDRRRGTSPSVEQDSDEDGWSILTHSTAGYRRGCRCDTCRDAMRDYQRERRARTKVSS